MAGRYSQVEIGTDRAERLFLTAQAASRPPLAMMEEIALRRASTLRVHSMVAIIIFLETGHCISSERVPIVDELAEEKAIADAGSIAQHNTSTDDDARR
eukprot:scaffold12771_cov86-Skeletonema_menzelii.AAC.2